MKCSILGCGWLGLELAKHLHQIGYTVQGSTTSPDKRPMLQRHGIIPYIIDITPNIINGDDSTSFFQSPILIVTLPFRRHLMDPFDYPRQLATVLQEYQTQTPQGILIFTSSTSIYSMTNDWVTESSSIVPSTPRQQALLDTENLLLHSDAITSVILRLGGLYGGNRHIGAFLSDKKCVGHLPVNLIHRSDVIGIITALLQTSITPSIFNCVSPEHPLKKDLYTFHATQRNFPLPHFIDDSSASYKLVSSEKIQNTLGYSFNYPNPRSHYD